MMNDFTPEKPTKNKNSGPIKGSPVANYPWPDKGRKNAPLGGGSPKAGATRMKKM